MIKYGHLPADPGTRNNRRQILSANDLPRGTRGACARGACAIPRSGAAIGFESKNPMFLEKRVYQGSSGKVYPLPELGGRIQRAQDKTNGYDFATTSPPI